MLNKTLHTKSLSTCSMIRLDWNSDASKIEKDGYVCMYVCMYGVVLRRNPIDVDLKIWWERNRENEKF